MKNWFLFSCLFTISWSFSQINSLKTSSETPCYERANQVRKKGVNVWECGQVVGAINCNQELEYDFESKLFLRKASGFENRMGDGKPFTGTCESCFMSGLLERRIHFVDGRENGVDTTYYKDGCIMVIRNHVMGAESGTWTYFYDSTAVMAWQMNYQLGEKHGTQVYYNKRGDTTKLETYQYGKLHGIKKSYYGNGKIYKIVNYKEGLLDGSFQLFNKEGVVIEETNYKKNNKHGKQKYYYDDGVLLRTGNWDEGMKVGTFKMFYYQGFPQTIENYNKKGQKDGKFEEYYANQQLKQRAIYKEDELIEEHRFDKHGNETYTFGAAADSSSEDDKLKKK